MAKKVLTIIKLQIPGGQANPAPPVGPALGQHGVNIMEFCKAYNAQTAHENGRIIPVEITVFEDRSFTFITKTPPAAVLIKEALGLESGSGEPNRNKVGRLTAGAAPLDRGGEDARPQRARRRRGDEGDRRDGAEHGCGDMSACASRATQRPAAPAAASGISRTRICPADPSSADRGGAVSAHGKRYRAAREAIDREQAYTPLAALRLLKESPAAKFDETVEVHFRLGLNVRHADEQLRGTIMLPHGIGKDVRVAVFAEGEKAREAEDAGADVVGSADLATKIEGGFLDFDVAIATPDQMSVVGKLGRVLGPRGLMPNPKTGTVTMDVGKAVSDAKAGKLEYRTDRGGNVHLPIGKRSFDERALLENYAALVEEIVRAKPSAAKGRYIKQITLTTTMGPGIHVDSTITRDIAEELEAATVSA